MAKSVSDESMALKTYREKRAMRRAKKITSGDRIVRTAAAASKRKAAAGGEKITSWQSRIFGRGSGCALRSDGSKMASAASDALQNKTECGIV